MTKSIHILLSLVFLFFSLLPSVYEVRQSTKLHGDRAFELIANYYTDYNFYLSRIRQGLEGRITALEKYTSEKHAGSFIQAFYLFLGWAGRVVNVPASLAGYPYHVARTMFGGALLIAISIIAKKLFTFRIWQVIAFLLVVTASSWPVSQPSQALYRIGSYMPWWTVMDPLQRITFIPHIVVSQVLVLALIFLLSDRFVLVRPGNWIFLGILGFMLGFIFPPALMLVYAGVAISFVLHGLFATRRKNEIATEQYALALFVFFLVSVPSLVYFQVMLSFNPWKRLMDFYVVRPPVFPIHEYLMALGPVLPMGVFGGILAFIKKEKRMIGAVSWVIAWIILLSVFSFIKQTSPLRATEFAPHIPLGILAAYVWSTLYRYTLASIHTSARLRGLAVGVRVLALVAPIGTIAVGLLLMYNSFLSQRDFIDHKIRATYPLVHGNNTIMYPLKDFIGAIRYLESNTPRDAIVLGERTAGNYIPSYSGNTVYIGQDNTVNAEEKKLKAEKFFSGTMERNDAREWLVSEGIQYVYYGPQERDDGGPDDLLTVYPFLRELYRNMLVIVYQVPI